MCENVHSEWGWERLERELLAHGGFGGKTQLLRKCGLVSWYHLGSVTNKRWEIMLDRIPQKRPDHGEDLYDDLRLGVGHMQHIDMLRELAVQDRTMESYENLSITLHDNHRKTTVLL